MADAVADVIGTDDGHSLALFGHSMGALLAYEVGSRLEQTGVRLAAVFVSAAPPPRVGYDEGIHLLPDAELTEHLRNLSGTEAPLLDKEVLPLILPAVRADYQAVETYRFRDRSPLACPLTVLVSDDDPGVEPTQATGWGEHTTASFEVFEFRGDHFYLRHQEDAVAATIRARLTPWAPMNAYEVYARRRVNRLAPTVATTR